MKYEDFLQVIQASQVLHQRGSKVHSHLKALKIHFRLILAWDIRNNKGFCKYIRGPGVTEQYRRQKTLNTFLPLNLREYNQPPRIPRLKDLGEERMIIFCGRSGQKIANWLNYKCVRPAGTHPQVLKKLTDVIWRNGKTAPNGWTRWHSATLPTPTIMRLEEESRCNTKKHKT